MNARTAATIAAYADCFKGSVRYLGTLGTRRIGELVGSSPMSCDHAYSATWWAMSDGTIASCHDVTDEVTVYNVDWREW